MNRWQAIVAIVKSFNDRGATTLGFAAFCVFLVVPTAGLAYVALKIDWPDINLLSSERATAEPKRGRPPARLSLPGDVTPLA